MAASPVGRYVLAVLATIVATGVRIPLQPLLRERVPFGHYLLVVLVTTWWLGTGPALVALVLGLVAATTFVIAPHGSVIVDSAPDLFALGVYAIVGIVAVLLCDGMRTEHELAEERATENARLAEKLRQASRQKDHFLAMLAHELRNPLAPIRTGLDLLDRSPGEPTATRTREKLRRQMEQLVRIVDDLLDVSRFVRGKITLRRETLDLREVVDLSLEMMGPELVEREHRVILDLPSEPIHVDGDRLRLVQVVSNLVGNAGKYTPTGGEIRILAGHVDGLVRLEVIDNGIGIPQGECESIFQMFEQARGPGIRDAGGLGLGLTIVHGIVEMHGGRVWAESLGEGRGSRFVITLPQVEPTPEPQPVDIDDRIDVSTANARATERFVEVAPPPIRDTTVDFALLRDTVKMDEVRVLIVDDNADAAETLAALITLEGCAARAVNDGPTALDSVETFEPDVVLLDIGLPGMDGYEVARRIVERLGEDRPRLVAVTGWGGPEDRRRSAEAGFDHHFVKPVATADLMNQVRPRGASPVGDSPGSQS